MLDNLFPEGMKKEEPEDLRRTTKIIAPLINKTANEVFISYKTKLLTEPIDYIVPAIWGAKKDGELEATQKEINTQIIVLIEQLFDSLQLENLTPPQEFAIGFLIRELIISRTTLMIEMLKNQIFAKLYSEGQESDIVNHLDSLGNAGEICLFNE